MNPPPSSKDSTNLNDNQTSVQQNQQNKKQKNAALPQRLEPSVSLADGSLLCTPLSTVILAACNELYEDLLTLTHGTVQVMTTKAGAASAGDTSSQTSEGGGGGNEYRQHQVKMSSLSYAQRRHELTTRLAVHIKSISHATALVSAFCGDYAKLEGPLTATDNSLIDKLVKNSSRSSNGLLGECIRVSDQALQHVFEAWSMADEAQDALYFSHGSLWNARKQCHDIIGAMDVYLSGTWRDIPSDVELQVDPYDKSTEKHYTKPEILSRLQACVRRKLVNSEIGEAKLNNKMNEFLWENIILEQNGGSIKLTYGGQFGGKLKSGQSKRQLGFEENIENIPRVYPIEARLTGRLSLWNFNAPFCH